MKSKEWLNRQKNDHYVIKAKQKGYFSRSAFKLLEIDEKYKIIIKSNNTFEFGASPGGWSQILLEINPNIKITAIDLLQLKFNHKNIHFFKEDFLNFDFNKIVQNYDLVLVNQVILYQMILMLMLIGQEVLIYALKEMLKVQH